MKTHELKTMQPYFNAVFYGKKDFEVRKNDRNFKVGDFVKLIEVVPSPLISQRYVVKEIKYILNGGQFGIDKDYVVLGLKELRIAQPLSEIIAKEKAFEITGRI